MRLVFISSVTAMTPLRTISVTTGSMRRFFPFDLCVAFLGSIRFCIGLLNSNQRALSFPRRPGPVRRVSRYGTIVISRQVRDSAFAERTVYASRIRLEAIFGAVAHDVAE